MLELIPREELKEEKRIEPDGCPSMALEIYSILAGYGEMRKLRK